MKSKKIFINNCTRIVNVFVLYTKDVDVREGDTLCIWNKNRMTGFPDTKAMVKRVVHDERAPMIIVETEPFFKSGFTGIDNSNLRIHNSSFIMEDIKELFREYNEIWIRIKNELKKQGLDI